MCKRILLTLTFLSLSGFGLMPLHAAEFLTIGTGGVTGVYYPAGGAICKVVNDGRAQHKIKCNVEATGGSLYNANAIKNKTLEMGIVQSDVVHNAWEGKGDFTEKHASLRSVFTLHSESLTLVARKDAKINGLADLKGKRVNIGNPGSGTRRTVEALFEACALGSKDLTLAAELKPAEMPDALRDNKIDAYFYVVGHPTANIKDVATGTDIQIIPLTGTCVDSLLAARPYFAKSSIPKGLYRGVDQDVPSFGVKATLVASSHLKDAVVYETAKAILATLPQFKSLHPSFAEISPASMLEGLSAPIHDGALRFYREQKLISNGGEAPKNIAPPQ